MSHTIGAYALNASFLLYLIHYLPQLIHNTKQVKLREISLHFHGLLAICYVADLSYGIGMHMPWQYRAVSMVGIFCLTIQHWQLYVVHRRSRVFNNYSFIILFMLLAIAIETLGPQQPIFFLSMGYVAYTTAVFFLLPAIVRQYKRKSALSLSSGYLGFNYLCYTTNVVAAFCLNWPMPSKLGALFGVLCMSVLIVQKRVYRQAKPSGDPLIC